MIIKIDTEVSDYKGIPDIRVNSKDVLTIERID